MPQRDFSTAPARTNAFTSSGFWRITKRPSPPNAVKQWLFNDRRMIFNFGLLLSNKEPTPAMVNTAPALPAQARPVKKAWRNVMAWTSSGRTSFNVVKIYRPASVGWADWRTRMFRRSSPPDPQRRDFAHLSPHRLWRDAIPPCAMMALASGRRLNQNHTHVVDDQQEFYSPTSCGFSDLKNHGRSCVRFLVQCIRRVETGAARLSAAGRVRAKFLDSHRADQESISGEAGQPIKA